MKEERLWAPWRLGYITSDKKNPKEGPLEFLPDADPDCFLCQYAARDDDCDHLVVERRGEVITCLNIYPYNNGHLLVSPRRHVATLEDLDDGTLCELTRTIARMTKVLRSVLNPTGFNIGLNLGASGGAGIPGHLHWHIVPRWEGDTNFMPTLAGVRVIPQSLEALWEALQEKLVDA